MNKKPELAFSRRLTVASMMTPMEYNALKMAHNAREVHLWNDKARQVVDHVLKRLVRGAL